MINPNHKVKISQLDFDEIAFPKIDYKGNEPLILNSTTLLAAYTTISERVDPKFISPLQWRKKGDIAWQNAMLQQLSERIYRMIEEYQQSKSDFLITQIFIWIQLWGGSAGRSIFVRGKKWPNNYKIEIYIKAVNQIHNREYIESLITLNSLFGINTAFSTKHIHFWSKSDAPIYDSIIAAIVFGRNKNQVRAKEYPRYIEALDNLVNQINTKGVNRSSIERSLFNWANSNEGSIWREIRLNKT